MHQPHASINRRQAVLGISAGLAAAACSTERAGRTSAKSIPLIYDDQGGLFVEARVAGSGPVLLILDTGASRSTVSSEFARTWGLGLENGGEVEGSAGVVRAQRARAPVEIAGMISERVDFLVYDFRSYDPRCVGILGHEILRLAPFELRYRERAWIWNASPPPRTIPLHLDGGIPRIAAQVNGDTLELRLDTGAAFPPGKDAYLNLSRPQAEALGLTGTPLKVFTATGTGDAVLELPVHALASLEIAGVALQRAFAIVQPAVGYFSRPEAVGFLGNSVLDKLDPYCDYASGVFAACV